MSGAEAAGRLLSEAVPGSRWFISASTGIDLAPLIAGMRRRGAVPYVLSDVAPLGANILESVRQAISTADHVLVVLGRDVGSLGSNTLFEAGMAVGLGKQVVLVADPGAVIPADVAGLLTVRARPDDVDAIDFALDQAEGRIATITQSPLVTGHALGRNADQLLAELGSTSSVGGRLAVDLLARALEGSGTLVVEGRLDDERFDLGVWSDDLDAIAANPLVIEVKNRFSAAAVQQVWEALQSTHSARAALLVYVDREAGEADDLRTARFPVLAISLADLIVRMRTATFAEVVRDLRNRSVHGLPPS